MNENKNIKKLTKENLIKLGFKEEYVSAEDSGGSEFYYYIHEVKDAFNKEKCVLITNAHDEAKNWEFVVEFFNAPEIGNFTKYEDVAELISALKKASNK